MKKEYQGLKIRHSEQDDNYLKSKNLSFGAILDKHKPTVDGLYPVRLRIIYHLKYKQYATKIFLPEDKFNNIALGKAKNSDVSLSLFSKMKIAYDIIIEILHKGDFSFSEFENKFLGKSDWNNVKYAFEKYSNDLIDSNKVETANTIKGCYNSLLDFCKKEDLTFAELTPDFLKKYQHYMQSPKAVKVLVKVKGKNIKKEKIKSVPARSATTVGFHMRALRSVFNKAIAMGVDKKHYPFGTKESGKYDIPIGDSRKKALTLDDMKKLFDGTPQTPEQAKAKDFWFLSFFWNGANIKDILSLKFENFNKDELSFVRAKTMNTTKKTIRISLIMNDKSKEIFARYKKPFGSKSDYVFDVLQADDSPVTIQRKIKIFTRFVNQHMQKYAPTCGLDENISTYTARHTFATLLIRTNTSMEYISEAFGHASLKTTQIYFGGFETADRKKVSDKLSDLISGN